MRPLESSLSRQRRRRVNTAAYLAAVFLAGSCPFVSHAAGAKWEVIRGTVLEFGLIENIFTFSNSPDFGIHLGITSRF